MVTVDDIRVVAQAVPRTQERLVQDRVKFRVGRLVYLSFSRDETLMGFAFPKEERAALVAADPDVFLMPCSQREAMSQRDRGTGVGVIGTPCNRSSTTEKYARQHAVSGQRWN